MVTEFNTVAPSYCREYCACKQYKSKAIALILIIAERPTDVHVSVRCEVTYSPWLTFVRMLKSLGDLHKSIDERHLANESKQSAWETHKVQNC